MPNIIGDDQISTEMAPGFKPTVIDSGFDPLPISALGDRDFEFLAYSLVKAEIDAGTHTGFTSVALMQGVGERGRDCVLYRDSRVAGLIQCKKYTSRINKTQILKELLKFSLFALLDSSICPHPDQFTYHFYVSSDLTEPAINLIGTYQEQIKNEIASGTINKHMADVAEEYESFTPFRDNLPIDKVNNLLQKFVVNVSTGLDLTQRLYAQPEILKNFFSVKVMASHENLKQVLRETLSDSGIPFLTDDDLKHIQQRVTSASEEHRISLGNIDFFGFSVAFFRSLSRSEFKELIEKITGVRIFLDAKLFNFLQSEIMKRVFDEITVKLLHTGKIHPFSIGLAAPYLAKRLSPLVMSGSIPDSLLGKYSPASSKSSADILSEVSKVLFDASERIMRGDHSQLTGDAPIIAQKMTLYRHMHQGFSKIQDAKDRLAIDLPVITPAIEKIEADIGALISKSRTVLIGDSSFFDDKDRIKKLAKSLGEIGELGEKSH
jgi:hypothetical protein